MKLTNSQGKPARKARSTPRRSSAKARHASIRTVQRKPRARPLRPRATYHHGDLRAAMVTATLALIEEQGPEQVSVREAARRAGVSSGAPFRHFPTRIALLTAVAEEALRRFEAEIEGALTEARSGDPLARFRAIGVAFIRWALRNPTHFQVIMSPHLTDWAHSAVLQRDNARIQELTTQCVVDAQAQGLLPPGDPHLTVVASRALVYGLARMAIDRHFPRWGVPEADAEATALRAIDLFLEGLAARPRK